MVGDVEKLIESKELELQIDKHFASGGTVQIGGKSCFKKQ
jgi:hypothetical protein